MSERPPDDEYSLSKHAEVVSLADDPSSRLTMDEIVEKIANNEQIPGIKRIEAKLHETGSKAMLSPIKKPWDS